MRCIVNTPFMVPVVLAGVTAGASGAGAQEVRPAIEAESVMSAADTFALMVGGATMGTQVVSLTHEGGGFVFREETTTPQGEQTTVVAMGLDLTMETVHQRGTMASQGLMINVTYEAGWARGRARVLGPTGVEEVEVRSEVPDGVVDDNALIGLLPGMQLGVGTRIRVPVFQSGQNRLVEYILTVEDAGMVSVPAGEFAAHRIRATDGRSSIVFMVRADAPHRVLAVEPQDGPLRLVRTGPR